MVSATCAGDASRGWPVLPTNARASLTNAAVSRLPAPIKKPRRESIRKLQNSHTHLERDLLLPRERPHHCHHRCRSRLVGGAEALSGCGLAVAEPLSQCNRRCRAPQLFGLLVGPTSHSPSPPADEPGWCRPPSAAACGGDRLESCCSALSAKRAVASGADLRNVPRRRPPCAMSGP